MVYMRIPRNKFWAWVVVSMLVGLGIGLSIMAWRTAALSGQIALLQDRADASSATSETLAAVRTQLASAEASVSALTDRNAELTSDLAAAKGGTGSTSSTAPAIAVVSRTVSPGTVDSEGTITLTAKVTGHPTSVTMRVYTTSKDFDKTYTLRRLSTSGNSETWRTTAEAAAAEGTYHYYATAIKGGTRVTMPGASPKSFTVE